MSKKEEQSQHKTPDVKAERLKAKAVEAEVRKSVFQVINQKTKDAQRERVKLRAPEEEEFARSVFKVIEKAVEEPKDKAPPKKESDEFKLFDASAPALNEAADLTGFAHLKLNPNIHLELGKADKRIDVTPNNFPLNRYDPLKRVVTGKRSNVYIANDLLVGNTVLIKVSTDPANSLEREQFAEQAKIAKPFKDNGVYPIIDHGITSGGNTYTVSENITGMTLKQYLAENAPVDPVLIVSIFIEICNYVHQCNLAGMFLNEIDLDRIVLIPTIFGQVTVKLYEFGINEIKDATDSETADAQVLNTPWNDAMTIGRALRDALANQELYAKKFKEGPIHLPTWTNEAKQPITLEEPIEVILARTSSTKPGERFDSVLTLRHELAGLKELLTYSKPKTADRKTEKLDDKNKKILAVAVPLAVAALVCLAPFVKPDALPTVKSDTQAFPDYLPGLTDDPLPDEDNSVQTKFFEPRLPNFEVSGQELQIQNARADGSNVSQTLKTFATRARRDAVNYNPVVPPKEDVFTSPGESEPTSYPYFPIENVSRLSAENSTFDQSAFDVLAKQPEISLFRFDNCKGFTKNSFNHFFEADTFSYASTLRFKNTDISGLSLIGLKGKRIHLLEVADCKFDDIDLMSLAQLNIETLVLKNTRVTNAGIKQFAKLKPAGIDGFTLVDNKKVTLKYAQLRRLFPNVFVFNDGKYDLDD